MARATAPGSKVARPSRGPVRHLHFPGSGLSIRLADAAPVQQALGQALNGWRPRVTAAPSPGTRRASLTGGAGGYGARSPFHPDALGGLDMAGAICALVADLSEGYLAQRPGCFALHCGAFRFGGDLIMLTGPMRAGKSTLIGRLTAEPDVTVFCDDVLPMTPELEAVALGVAPRLRLPLPQAASALFRDHVARVPGPRDAAYAYLAAPGVAPHGTRARPGTLIVLDRRPQGAATLHRMDPDQAVHHLLAQNMGDLGSAAQAFDVARRLSAGLCCLRLVYHDLEEAVDLLRRAFAGGGAEPAVPPAPPLPEPLHAPERGARPVAQGVVLRQASGVILRRLGAGAFLWRPMGATVWHLNPVGHAVWTLLQIPGSAADLAQTLAEVFPDVPCARLTADIAALMGDLRDEGFLIA